MAYFKYQQILQHNTNSVFDQALQPGSIAPYSGIYFCLSCGREETCNEGKPLPPENHAQHTPPKPIQWQLIVMTAWVDASGAHPPPP